MALWKSMPLLSLSPQFSKIPNLSQQFSAIPTGSCGLVFLIPRCSQSFMLMQLCIVCCTDSQVLWQILLFLLLPSHFQVLWTDLSQREKSWKDGSPHFNSNCIYGVSKRENGQARKEKQEMC